MSDPTQLRRQVRRTFIAFLLPLLAMLAIVAALILRAVT